MAGHAFDGIIGRSGAGKSSLLRTVNRLEEPTSGRVLIDGAPIEALDTAGLVALPHRIGVIFQHVNLLSAKTVRQNVALPLAIAGVPKGEIGPRVAEALRLVGLEKAQACPPRLSGGQKQRVGIARALVSRPEILLCDGATSALDPETTPAIPTPLRDIDRRLGITIVLITHEMSVIRNGPPQPSGRITETCADTTFHPSSGKRTVDDRSLGDDVEHALARVEGALGILEHHLDPPAGAGASAGGSARRRRGRRAGSRRRSPPSAG